MELDYFYNIGNKQSEKIWHRLLELKLVKKDKKYSIEELKEILKNPEIFPELSEATKCDLTYNPVRKIPRPIIELIEKEFKKHLGKKKIRFNIAGSYLRGKLVSSDIDMVLNSDDSCKVFGKDITKIWPGIKKLINSRSKFIKFTDPFANGPDKIGTLIQVDLIKSGLEKIPEVKNLLLNTGTDIVCNSGLCKVYVKIDIFLSNTQDYIFAMLFATGSGLFNVRMRYLAKRKGMLLNNHGLWKKVDQNNLEKIPIQTEKEIFEILGMTYKSPRERMK